MTHSTSHALLILKLRIETIVRGERRQGLVEYSMILVFIALIGLAGLALLGTPTSSLLGEAAQKL
jgi:Flp pilus assembly pilin Flp